MMNELKFSKEKVGELLLRKRMALGLTQEQVAERLQVTRQSVAKNEKNGVSDISLLDDYARVFNCNVYDFFKDAYDAEGEVGIVGKEILGILAQHEGFITIQNLAKKYMYGMKQQRINIEISKLSNLGLCVREQYVDFYDKEIDGLFITAKGLITVKNCTWNTQRTSELQDKIPWTKTYEMIVGEESCYQNILNERDLERRIRQMGYFGSYRVDYIQWLHENFCEDYYGCESNPNYEKKVPCLPGKNIVADVTYRMMMGMDNSLLEEVFREFLYKDNAMIEQKEKQMLEEEERSLYEGLGREFQEDLCEGTPYDVYLMELEDWLEINFKDTESVKDRREERKLEQELIVEGWRDAELYESRLELIQAKYSLESGSGQWWYEIKKKEAVDEGREWPPIYSEYEMLCFIKDNYKDATAKEEHEIDRRIEEINEDFPETTAYFDIPVEWRFSEIAEELFGGKWM